MPIVFVIIIEVVVRLALTIALGAGAFILFNTKKRHAIWASLLGIGCIAVLFNVFVPSSYMPSSHLTFTHTLTAKQEANSKKRESSRASESRKKAAVSNSKASESKKGKKDADRDKQENFAAYELTLTKIPKNTKHVITDAHYNGTGTTYVLSDEVLNYSDSALKNVVKTAWNSGQELIKKAAPFPNDKAAAEIYVTIEDSAGNRLAHTSAFGSFKYDGEK